MGIFQRQLENFDEKPILINKETNGNCMNCHNFCNNNPDKMVLHLRAGKASGTLIGGNGKFIKVDTGTKLTKAGAYPSWHPNGKIIAFSVNKLEMFFHATSEPRDVLDRGADLILYNIDTNTVTSSPLISDPERMESFPAWSPDGQYLYFCSSPKFESFLEGDTYRYDQVMYELMRIRYYPENGTWGELETVLPAAKIGKSISMPRISPDGRYLLFCTAEYGNFPIYMPDGDLWLLDLNNNEYRTVASDSNQADTFHSWSSNSRWFVFSSKRGDGICARPYIAHVSEQGVVSKPFVLPQKDPTFYVTFYQTFNVPELIKGPVKIRPQQLAKVAFDNEHKKSAQLDPALVAHFKTKSASDKKYAPAPQ
jgi:dipeptidyl aminopeptidase/acylaminoacyl peptidase